MNDGDEGYKRMEEEVGKVWIEVKTVLASTPERPPPVLAVMNWPDGLQNDCMKHKMLAAWVGYPETAEDWLIEPASVNPSRKARC